MRGAWKLAALVVGAVAFCHMDVFKAQAAGSWGNGAGGKGERITINNYGPTESGDMLGSLWENVVISGRSPEIEKLCTVLHVLYILGSDGGAGHGRSHTAVCRSAGAKETSSGRRGRGKVEPKRQWTISQFTIRLNNEITRRSVSAVSPNWAESPIIQSRLAADFPIRKDSLSENEGLLIGNQGFFGQFGLSICNRHQDYGENGNCRRSCGSYGVGGPFFWIKYYADETHSRSIQSGFSGGLSAQDGLNKLEINQARFPLTPVPPQMRRVGVADLKQNNGMVGFVATGESIPSTDHDCGLSGRPVSLKVFFVLSAGFSFSDILAEGFGGYLHSATVTLKRFVRKQNNPEIEERISAPICGVVTPFPSLNEITAKPRLNFQMSGRRFAYICEIKSNTNADLVFAEYKILSDFGGNCNPCAICCNQGPFGDRGRPICDSNGLLHFVGLPLGNGFGAQSLLVSSIPELVGRSAQRESEPSYKNRSSGGNEPIVIIEGRSDFAKRETNYTISGALFCAFLCGFAYLVMRRYI
jgi:hypothetical protein